MASPVQIPPEFICPITLEIMKEPYILPDGQTYEKEAIREALVLKQVSPLTKAPMKFEDGKVNYALKSLIENFLKDHPEVNVNEKRDIPGVPRIKSINVAIESMSANYIVDPNDEHKCFIDVKIKPVTPVRRAPILLIAMMDVSGSMGQDSCKTVAGMEDISFSRLQLVQHSLNTIISVLGEEDMICLIEFSSRASILLEPKLLNKEGKEQALNTIKQMNPSGTTNIWDALRLGINEAEKFSESVYSTYLLLFTDGEPNVNPPMGIVPSLKEKLSDIKMNFTLSTFAFGYSVDSELMEDIAKVGNGIYGYCPDCTMVGTIFINYMANILTTVTPVCQVCVKHPKLEVKHTIGGLYQDVSRNLLISVPKETVKETKLEINLQITDQRFSVPVGELIQDGEEMNEIMDQYYRQKLIELIETHMSDHKREGARESVKNLFEEIDAIQNKTEFMKNLLTDLIHDDDNHGQVMKSFQDEYYSKWGKDYLRSFVRFHNLEVCGNFKDQSLKLYGGKSFEERRKEANKIFLELQPPERVSYDHNPVGPMHKAMGARNARGMNLNMLAMAAGSRGPRLNMSRFMDYSGGCFTGEGLVKLLNGTKQVKDLCKGDVLAGGSIVKCLVVSKVGGIQGAVELNGTYFTPYHPVINNGFWVFPIDIKQPTEVYVDSWYNLVLEGGFAVEINGIIATTLGHGQKEGVLSHPYFGTQKVIEALKKHEGYEEGCVKVENLNPVRDENGLITSYY